MKDLQLGPMACVAEAPRQSVGHGFELGRWSLFSCRLSLEQCLHRSFYNKYYILHTNGEAQQYPEVLYFMCDVVGVKSSTGLVHFSCCTQKHAIPDIISM